MPLNEEQLWQVTKAAALLDPSLSRPSNRELDGALCAALAQYGVAAGRGVLGEPRRHAIRVERREQSARHRGA